jgi:hypothetical protein
LIDRRTQIAMSWCFKNNIKVIVKPLTRTRRPDVKLEIHREGKIQTGKEIYRQDKKLADKISQLYLYLYETLR